MIKFLIWFGLAPTGQSTIYIPTIGFTPGAASTAVAGPLCFEAVEVSIPWVQAVQVGCP